MTRSILAVADSDSYLKYAAHLLNALPGWKRRIIVVRSPTSPTSAQTRAALAGTWLEGHPPAVVPLRRLLAEATPRPDVVLAAATGPVAQEVLLRFAALPNRPVLASALPGIAHPATVKAVAHRELSDVFLVHSIAEAAAFAALKGVVVPDGSGPVPHAGAGFGGGATGVTGAAETTGVAGVTGAAETAAADAADADAPVLPDLALARLPMLAHASLPRRTPEPTTRVVFAAQAKVPAAPEQRRAILLALATTARENPGVEVVVKLRAHRGEPQTHREAHPYDALWEELTQEGAVGGQELTWADGPLSAFMQPGSALVTVSSTAAIEALDAGLPVAVLSDFGVTEELLNNVFTGSGLLTTLAAVRSLEWPAVREEWGAQHYFHSAEAAEAAGLELAQDALTRLARERESGELPVQPAALGRARDRAWRQRLRTSLPGPVLDAGLALRERLRA